MGKKLTLKETKTLLKQKTLMFTSWNCEYPERYMHQNFYLPIKELFGDVILWDPKKRLIKYGPTEMKRQLIEAIKEKNPDFILFTVWGCGDFESIDLIKEFRKASPNSKIIGFYADDDRDFEISSRFYAPFIDYNIVVQPDFTDEYIKEGNKAYSFYVVDTKNYTPLNLEKKYDVSFIGTPSPSRLEVMRVLMNEGIKIELWGRGWLEYPEFRDVYHGEVNREDFNKIISQTKVNLGFIKNQEGKPHFKARVLENAALKTFTLIDYFEGYKLFFEEDKEIVMFKDTKDLIDKIKYYLENEKERESIAEKAYERVAKDLDIIERLIVIFKDIFEEEETFKPRMGWKLDEKVIKLRGDNLKLSSEELKDLVKNYNYITFQTSETKEFDKKEYFQIYSLQKTNKDISLSSYYIGSSGMGHIMRFRPFHAFTNLRKEYFDKLVNIDAVMVKKDYFVNNAEKFKEVFDGGIINFINDENTIFVDIPLFRTDNVNKGIISTINVLGTEAFAKAFQPNFAMKIYSRMHEKKLLGDPYIYKLLWSSLFGGNISILKYLYQAYHNKSNWDKLQRL
ncbi:MAG: glycosyltransferase [Candidatus Pacearchaeota archaeon]|nr:glycosyltransferase [Candidatus Pacearchaeota archaeon]